jgi:hypothetical protein
MAGSAASIVKTAQHFSRLLAFTPSHYSGFKMNINKAAAALGKLGGKSKSAAKRRASRENGKRGGRPKTKARFRGTPQPIAAGTTAHPLCAASG